MLMDKERDKVFKTYHSFVNMTYRELFLWSKTECSHKASLSRNPLDRNLHLLRLHCGDWGVIEVEWAKRTVNFIKRMSRHRGSKRMVEDCGITKRDISLKNWGFDVEKNKKRTKRVHNF